jgi:hypothetical protein
MLSTLCQRKLQPHILQAQYICIYLQYIFKQARTTKIKSTDRITRQHLNLSSLSEKEEKLWTKSNRYRKKTDLEKYWTLLWRFSYCPSLFVVFVVIFFSVSNIDHNFPFLLEDNKCLGFCHINRLCFSSYSVYLFICGCMTWHSMHTE